MHCILFSDFKCKELVFAGDGKKIGYPVDIEFDRDCGQIVNILVSCGGFCLPAFCKKNLIRIPWCEIDCIGEDIIWVHGCFKKDRWK
jgi:hypothetical protein